MEKEYQDWWAWCINTFPRLTEDEMRFIRCAFIAGFDAAYRSASRPVTEQKLTP